METKLVNRFIIQMIDKWMSGLLSSSFVCDKILESMT